MCQVDHLTHLRSIFVAVNGAKSTPTDWDRTLREQKQHSMKGDDDGGTKCSD